MISSTRLRTWSRWALDRHHRAALAPHGTSASTAGRPLQDATVNGKIYVVPSFAFVNWMTTAADLV